MTGAGQRPACRACFAARRNSAYNAIGAGRGRAMKTPSFTIGVEEEYQIFDPSTGELRSFITQILEEGKLVLKEQVKPELHQSIVEVGTEICRTPAEAKAEIIRLRGSIMDLAKRGGLEIAAAGTHPFS